jgi:tight adherence protein C
MLIASVFVGVMAIFVAGFSLTAMLRQRDVLRRIAGKDDDAPAIAPLIPDKTPSKFLQKMAKLFPESADTSEIRSKLLQAGIESRSAPLVYFLFRMLSLLVFPIAALFLAPQTMPVLYFLLVSLGVFTGVIVPMAILDRMVRVRQHTITRSVPDALDLLVVCVEAGISLDAAILRVSRELRYLHPELSDEMAVVSRQTNAGVTRENALRGLWERTGVMELRTITSSMVQSEKLGTSVATVLRVSAETLRRKRRQAAEKRAKQAPVKMIFPLLLFILPALFIVVLGPAIFTVIKELGKI